uniref:Cyclin N-terminal domain-containing protein n=1 Tax=Rhodosporidiobolus colostri TaxID=255053 RepID=A0A9E9JWQ5_9BASI|nr:hypothetical protein [Rhodosporidiobolus colostri]
MKVPTASTSSAARTTAYPKKRSPSGRGSRSPASKRTSPMSVEMQRHAQMSSAERQLLPLLEREYREDVRAYMYEMQSKTVADANLIDQQPELKWYMRGFLVDFLVEIHLQHRLRPETLYLALNIVDRYVSKRIVFKKHYQLVGCAALWIAAKFEDAKDRVPTLPELVDMCSNAYDEKAFVQMEGHVLSTIQWVIGHPTSEAWLRLACVTGSIEDLRTQHVARFLMELTLFHREFIQFYTSDIAMASLLLARYMLGKTRRPQDESEPVLRIILMLDELLGEHLEEVSPIVLKKYSLPAYSRASTFAREWYLCGRRFQSHDYSLPTSLPSTPLRPLMRSSSSSAASSSSSIRADISSTPTRSDGGDSDTSLESDDDEDDDNDSSSSCEDEPLTPITPLPPVSDPFLSIEQSVALHKENYSAPLKGSAHPGLPAVRQPLERARWEMNNHQVVYPSSGINSSPSAYGR